MTILEKQIAQALLNCSFTPGSFDKKFVRQLPNWDKKDMTEKGRACMIKLFHRYRRQIPNYQQINHELNGQLKVELDPSSYEIQFNLFGGMDIIKQADESSNNSPTVGEFGSVRRKKVRNP